MLERTWDIPSQVSRGRGTHLDGRHARSHGSCLLLDVCTDREKLLDQDGDYRVLLDGASRL